MKLKIKDMLKTRQSASGFIEITAEETKVVCFTLDDACTLKFVLYDAIDALNHFIDDKHRSEQTITYKE